MLHLKLAFMLCHYRNRGEEGGVSQEYLEELHGNHEDWLLHGDSPEAIAKAAKNWTEASVLTPLRGPDADSVLREFTSSREIDSWKVEVLGGVPDAIREHVRHWAMRGK